MKLIVIGLFAMLTASVAAASPIRVEVEDIPGVVRLACLSGPLRQHCAKPLLDAADWAMAHPEQAVTMTCNVQVERWDELLQRIGCARLSSTGHGRADIAFDLRTLTTIEVDRIVRRCSGKGEPGAISQAGSSEGLAAAAQQAASDVRCLADLEATLHLQRNVKGRNFHFVLRDVELTWRY